MLWNFFAISGIIGWVIVMVIGVLAFLYPSGDQL
jgi:hypothetical protein